MPLLIRPRVGRQRPPPPQYKMRKVTDNSAVLVQGMQGLGDNLHQRAVIRRLMERSMVYLETPWPCIYYDLVGPRLALLQSGTALRTQRKNAKREAERYANIQSPRGLRTIRVWYTGEDVRTHGSIFGAMMRNVGFDPLECDFSLPIPAAWLAPVDELLARWQPKKPVLLYRPLVERTEWRGCAGRNPDHDAYAEIFAAVRNDFFVVSIADLMPNVEWIVGRPITADVTLHSGELSFESLAALAHRAQTVYAAAGFAPLLAQATGTPAVCVFGGHESSITISGGSRFSPTLGIDPITPCDCFSHTHNCDKRIDVPRAIALLQTFFNQHIHHRIDDAYTPARRIEHAVALHRLAHAASSLHEPGRTGNADRSDS